MSVGVGIKSLILTFPVRGEDIEDSHWPTQKQLFTQWLWFTLGTQPPQGVSVEIPKNDIYSDNEYVYVTAILTADKGDYHSQVLLGEIFYYYSR